MKLQLRRAALHPVKFLKTLGPLALSHHPQCEYFSNHSLKIRNHRFCIGCFVGYPVFAVSLVVLWMTPRFFGLSFGVIEALMIGIASESVTILVKAAHAGKSVGSKVAVKSSQGMGLAFIFYSVLTSQANVILKLSALLMVWSVFNAVMGAVRIYETGKACDACEYKGRWSKCPGFRETVGRLHEAGFVG